MLTKLMQSDNRGGHMVVLVKMDRLKEEIAKKNLSHTEFSNRAGISKGYMSQLMGGERNPSPALRKRILEALELGNNDFDSLFEIKS